MTTTYENFAALKAETAQKLAKTREVYTEAETELVKLVGDFVTGATVECQTYGPGEIVGYNGTTVENIIVEVKFAELTKKFSLQHIVAVAKFIRFTDTTEINVIWEDAMAAHTKLTAELNAVESLSKQLERDGAKLADEAKRAEAKYQAAKASAIKEFQAWVKAERPQSTADDFYFALGWLAKHVGTVSAALPDYMADEFKGYFGPDTPCRIVDSKKKGPAGWTSQWAKSYSVSLKKPEDMPSLLTKYLNPKGTALTDSDFVLELVDNYGFQFGKTQDIEKIRACVPTAHISFFENGLA